MHRNRLRLLACLLAVGILVAACGDDGDGAFASSTTEAGGTTAAGQETTTTAGGDTTTTAGGEETTTTAGELPAEIEELLARFRETPLRTTYLLEDDQEITFSQDPTQDPPVSAVLFEGGRIITSGDSYIMCSGEGAGSQCFEMPLEEGFDMASAMLGPFASLALSLQGTEDVPGMDVETDQVTIAGRSGVCFTYTPDASVGADYEYVRSCIDEELGFTLLVEVMNSGASEAERVMELVSVGDPEPSDFEPTGPVMPLPEG